MSKSRNAARLAGVAPSDTLGTAGQALVVKSGRTEMEYGSAGGGGVVGESLDLNEQLHIATQGQTVFSLSPSVDTDNTFVFLNGSRVSSTYITLTTSQLTLLSATNLDDEIAVVDHSGTVTSTVSTGGGVPLDLNEQIFTATGGQTVFALAPNVDTDSTLVFINGA